MTRFLRKAKIEILTPLDADIHDFLNKAVDIIYKLSPEAYINIHICAQEEIGVDEEE